MPASTDFAILAVAVALALLSVVYGASGFLQLERAFPPPHRVELDSLRARNARRHVIILQASVGSGDELVAQQEYKLEMLRPILRSKARWIMPYLAAPPRPSSRRKRTNFAQVQETQLRSLPSVKRNQVLRFEAPSDAEDSFDEMKQRFLNFKKRVYLEELEHFRRLAEEQTPKFMVIACADSRVCPSNILGFQPGEAFMIRNVANFVPPLENGPSETNAALEFAVNTLKVENILVIGHSRCGGIEALMSMEDDVNSSLVHQWISKAKAAKFRTRVGAPHQSFDLQCRHCEKESVNISLLNLLTYPWIEDRVRKDQLSIHGGYYDFLNCTFEKWTLDIKGADINGGRYLVKDQAFWS